jgi:hypothetical protein
MRCSNGVSAVCIGYLPAAQRSGLSKLSTKLSQIGENAATTAYPRFGVLELWRLTFARCYQPQFSCYDGIQCSFSGLANFSTSVALHGQCRASYDVALWVQRYLLDVS